MATKFLDYTGLSYLWGKIKAWCNATFAAITHSHASNAVNAMTGYSKPNSGSAIAASDSLNSARCLIMSYGCKGSIAPCFNLAPEVA